MNPQVSLSPAPPSYPRHYGNRSSKLVIRFRLPSPALLFSRSAHSFDPMFDHSNAVLASSAGECSLMERFSRSDK